MSVYTQIGNFIGKNTFICYSHSTIAPNPLSIYTWCSLSSDTFILVTGTSANIPRYQYKDNFHIFHLVPTF